MAPAQRLDPVAFEHYKACSILFDRDGDDLALWRQNMCDALAPFDEAERSWSAQELFTAGLKKFFFICKAVCIDMHKVKSAVVFGYDGIGRGDNRFFDPESLGNAFGKRGFSGSKIPSECNDSTFRCSSADFPADCKCSADMCTG